MDYGEIAFFNSQVAAMLRRGLPLEGALSNLAANMRRGRLKTEIDALQADLSRGTPLAEALETRRLPELYKRTLAAGAESGDLPGVLVLLADHYRRADSSWTRLKGLMVYPMIVLGFGLVISGFVAGIFGPFVHTFASELDYGQTIRAAGSAARLKVVVPPILLAIVTVFFVAAMAVPAWRRFWRWRLPGLKDDSVARVSSGLAVMMRAGCSLATAFRTFAAVERETLAGRDLDRWGERLAEGRSHFGELAEGSDAFPPMFVWLVDSAGENMPGGFEQAADVYRERARRRMQMVLYAALPLSIMLLGLMVFGQVAGVIGFLGHLVDAMCGIY